MSCAHAEKSVTDHAVLYYNDLSLISKKGTCILHSKAASKTTKLTLSLDPPCYFLRDGDTDKLKYYSYSRLDADFVVIVFGNPLNADERKMWNLKGGRICGGVAQGVIILNNNIRISEKVLRGGRTCTDGGHDEKDFWYFAKNS